MRRTRAHAAPGLARARARPRLHAVELVDAGGEVDEVAQRVPREVVLVDVDARGALVRVLLHLEDGGAGQRPRQRLARARLGLRLGAAANTGSRRHVKSKEQDKQAESRQKDKDTEATKERGHVSVEQVEK
eukprot:2892102-Pleurochrysis_carterae.AAC.2